MSWDTAIVVWAYPLCGDTIGEKTQMGDMPHQSHVPWAGHDRIVAWSDSQQRARSVQLVDLDVFDEDVVGFLVEREERVGARVARSSFPLDRARRLTGAGKEQGSIFAG